MGPNIQLQYCVSSKWVSCGWPTYVPGSVLALELHNYVLERMQKNTRYYLHISVVSNLDAYCNHPESFKNYKQLGTMFGDSDMIALGRTLNIRIYKALR